MREALEDVVANRSPIRSCAHR